MEARDASDSGTIIYENFSRVDGAINDAIHHLPFVYAGGGGANPLRWRIADQVS